MGIGVPTKYRMASDPSKSCATCAYYNPLMSSCNKFVTYVDKGAVCQAWTMGTKQAEAVVRKATAIIKYATTAKQVAQAASKADTKPTEDQKESGNYKKGHITIHGLDITIENPKGSTRSGESKDGHKWSIIMGSHYGYIKKTEGKDGDHVDVLIGPDPKSWLVYVINQVKPKTGAFDEHKCMLGCKSEKEARELYLKNYEKGWKGLGGVKFMIIPQFKRWLEKGDTSKPVATKKAQVLNWYQVKKAQARPNTAPSVGQPGKPEEQPAPITPTAGTVTPGAEQQAVAKPNPPALTYSTPVQKIPPAPKPEVNKIKGPLKAVGKN